jgi:TPR repeat protein
MPITEETTHRAVAVKKAQFNLGLLYENGQGVPQDYLQARQWYAKAAALGCADAQSRLGRLYKFRHGVPQDYGLGAELRDALAKRMTPATILLGGSH